MSHPAENVLSVVIDGEREPLGVTTTHPMWSEDRQEFVVAGQLKIGEHLRRSDGTLTQVTRITPHTGPPVMVHNLEVDGEHVYCVGGGSLLVHNTCPISVDDALDEAHKFMEPGVPIRSLDQPTGVQFIQNYVDANGNRITKRAGFDINPASRHVQDLGPHLNLQTQVNGKIIKNGPLADPHIPIDPGTIIPGDF